jgi:uncharacterized protein YkwD
MLCCLLLAGGLQTLAASSALAYTGRQIWDLHRLNRVRSAHGVRSALHLGGRMTRRAQSWANHLARLDRGAADDTSGATVCWRRDGSHYGANSALAKGFSDNLSRDQFDLEHSPPHLANIVNGRYRWVGIGIASSRRGLILVQDFCGR